MLNRSTCTLKPHTTSSQENTWLCIATSLQHFQKLISTMGSGLDLKIKFCRCLQYCWSSIRLAPHSRKLGLGGWVWEGSCGLGLFIGCVRTFSAHTGRILCSALLCCLLQEGSLLALCRRIQEDTRRRYKKMQEEGRRQESAEWQIPPPYSALLCSAQKFLRRRSANSLALLCSALICW